MSNEQFQPLPVKSPDLNPLKFRMRCFVDLQLKTIAAFLRIEMNSFNPGKIIDVGAGESPWRSWLPNGCTYFGIDIEQAGQFRMSNQNDDVTFYGGGDAV
jgi:hypothetical protein